MAINNSRYGSNQQPPRNRAFDLPPTGVASSLLAKKKSKPPRSRSFDLPPTGIASSLLAKKKKKTPPKATKKAAKRAVGPPRPGVSAAGGPPPMLRKRETQPPAAIAAPTAATAQGPQLTARENLYRIPVESPPQAGAAGVPTRQPISPTTVDRSREIGNRTGLPPSAEARRIFGETGATGQLSAPPIPTQQAQQPGTGVQLPPPGTQPDADPLAGTPDDPRYLREGLHGIPGQQPEQQPEQANGDGRRKRHQQSALNRGGSMPPTEQPNSTPQNPNLSGGQQLAEQLTADGFFSDR